MNFAQEWAKKNNVDLQVTLVPLKEFLPKITAAIEAKATPDIVESNAVELRGRGQLLDVTDIYQKLEKTYGGWVGNAHKFMLEPDRRGPPHNFWVPGVLFLKADGPLPPARAPPPPP